MKKLLIVITGVSIMLWSQPLFASAAALRLVASGTAIVGQPFQVDVVLDTQGDNANAVQATVDYPANLFSLQSVNDGNSIISFWITPPAATSSGEVQFAGIVPGGFVGSSGPIASFIFSPVSPGAATFDIATATILRNDGQGSPMSVSLTPIFVNITPSFGAAPTTTSALSLIAPNPFTPQIVQDPAMFNGHYFLVFATTDKGTGIDHYEVMEGSTWQVAQSPYLLKDQTLSTNIYVRAVDHAGNVTVAEVPARHPAVISWWIIALAVAGAAVLAGVLLFLIWFVKRRKRAR